MERPQCMPQATWDVIPPEAQAVLAVVIASFEVQIADLKASLERDSSNSSRPPSSDPPHRRPAPPRKPSGRGRGGQPGHRRNDRIRLEPDEVVDARPDHCRRCGEALAGDDPEPIVRQVFEVPVVRPHVVEHRLHRLACPRCGASSCGPPPDAADLGYGPRAGRLRGARGRGTDEQAARRPRDAGPLRPADRPRVGLRPGASHGRGPGPDPRRGPRTYPQAPRQRRRDAGLKGATEVGSGRPRPGGWPPSWSRRAAAATPSPS